MEKSNTREEILEAALDLFAVNGYEATSISQLDAIFGKMIVNKKHAGAKRTHADKERIWLCRRSSRNNPPNEKKAID